MERRFSNTFQVDRPSNAAMASKSSNGGVRPGDLDDDRVHQPVRFDHAPQRGDDAVVRDPRDARTVSACLHILEEPVHVLDLLVGCLCHFIGLSSTLSLIRMPFHPDPSGGP